MAHPVSEDHPEGELIARLRLRDEGAFRHLVRLHHRALVALARHQTRQAEAAEEVVQEAWITVLDRIADFEGRSALRTWICGIVVNKARQRAERDRRTSSFGDTAGGIEDDGAAMDPDRFLEDGRWRVPPWHWQQPDLDDEIEGRQLRVHLRAALDAISEPGRAVLILRDVEGRSAEETAGLLGQSEARQRTLLHRARLQLHRRIDALMRREPTASGPFESAE